MKARYLIYVVNHTVLLVDATPIGLPNEVYPPEGKRQMLPSLRFPGWPAAERFLLNGGATHEVLRETRRSLLASNLAVLTILN